MAILLARIFYLHYWELSCTGLIEGSFTDDTYMYDDEARGLSGRGHWYDEPPYESDPEDFLMGGGAPAATFQNGRVCFTLNLRNETRGEGVISLRSAGDISLARTPRRGLIIPQSGPYPTTVIPLRTARDRESGDYAASDIQSIGSRLSGISLESNRSERDSRRGYRQMSGYRIGADPLSPASSDYEDQESETDSQHIATVHKVKSSILLAFTVFSFLVENCLDTIIDFH